MKQRAPYRSYKSPTKRPYKRRSSVRSWYWRARDLLLLIAVAVLGLGTVTTWLRGKPDNQAQGLMSSEATSVYYRYCSHARAAGAAPLHAGEPGYRSELDRDGDGVACEPYSGG